MCCFAETGIQRQIVGTVTEIVHILTRTPIIGFRTTVKSTIIGCVKRIHISEISVCLPLCHTCKQKYIQNIKCCFFLVVIITFNAFVLDV